MVPSDNISTAKVITRECGILIEDGVAIEGANFREMSPNQMREIIPKIQVMARSLSPDKHTLVTNLREISTRWRPSRGTTQTMRRRCTRPTLGSPWKLPE